MVFNHFLYLLISPTSLFMAALVIEIWLTYDRMLPINGLFYELVYVLAPKGSALCVCGVCYGSLQEIVSLILI